MPRRSDNSVNLMTFYLSNAENNNNKKTKRKKKRKENKLKKNYILTPICLFAVLNIMQ